MRTPSPPRADQRGKASAQFKTQPVQKPLTAMQERKKAKWFAKCNLSKFQQKIAVVKKGKDKEKLDKEHAQAEVSKLFDKIAQLESDSDKVDQNDIDRKVKFTPLRKRFEQIVEESECPVCLERPADHVLSPCGHCYCCDESCPSSQLSECPMCCGKVESRIRVHGAIQSLGEMLAAGDLHANLK